MWNAISLVYQDLTCVAVSISYDDNRYTTGTSLKNDYNILHQLKSVLENEKQKILRDFEVYMDPPIPGPTADQDII